VAPELREGASDRGCPSCGREHSQTDADALSASSESAQELAARQAAAQAAFPQQVAEANANDEYLVWDATLDDRTTPLCQGRHGRRWGDGWFSPPPAHYNCRSVLIRVPKAGFQPPD
jgi:SPP1 gp7 family putative phage head morphogenesis protein